MRMTKTCPRFPNRNHFQYLLEEAPCENLCDYQQPPKLPLRFPSDTAIENPEGTVSDRPRKSKKTVRFSGNVIVRPTLHVKSYSPNEIIDCWYSTRECDVIKSTAKLIANVTEEHQGYDYCRRGLEFITPQGAVHKLKHKHVAWDTVFDEQELQWEDEVDEPEFLAEVYREVCAEAQAEAHARALRDHLDACM